MARLASTLCVLLVTAAPVSAAERDWIADTLTALDTHLATHPAAEAEDIYKLLHQAVTGPGHAVNDPMSARRWLDREIAGLAPTGIDEPLCEPIGGEPAMVRIHLRPFVARGLDPVGLADAFVASAAGPPPDPARLDAAVQRTADHLRDSGDTDRADALLTLRTELAARGFPATHHSSAFRAAYAPAYRVVRRGLAEAAGWCDHPATTPGTEPSDAGVGADADADLQGGN